MFAIMTVTWQQTGRPKRPPAGSSKPKQPIPAMEEKSRSFQLPSSCLSCCFPAERFCLPAPALSRNISVLMK